MSTKYKLIVVIAFLLFFIVQLILLGGAIAWMGLIGWLFNLGVVIHGIGYTARRKAADKEISEIGNNSSK